MTEAEIRKQWPLTEGTVADKFLIDELARRVLRQRKMEVTTLKCENAVMRLYGAKLPDPEPAPDVEQPAIPAPPALPGPPMNTADAIRQVLNGHPMDNTEIFAEIRKRFPDCQTTYETCRNSLSFLSKRKEVVSRSRGFGARLTYTKAVVDPKRC